MIPGIERQSLTKSSAPRDWMEAPPEINSVTARLTGKNGAAWYSVRQYSEAVLKKGNRMGSFFSVSLAVSVRRQQASVRAGRAYTRRAGFHLSCELRVGAREMLPGSDRKWPTDCTVWNEYLVTP